MILRLYFHPHIFGCHLFSLFLFTSTSLRKPLAVGKAAIDFHIRSAAVRCDSNEQCPGRLRSFPWRSVKGPFQGRRPFPCPFGKKHWGRWLVYSLSSVSCCNKGGSYVYPSIHQPTNGNLGHQWLQDMDSMDMDSFANHEAKGPWAGSPEMGKNMSGRYPRTASLHNPATRLRNKMFTAFYPGGQTLTCPFYKKNPRRSWRMETYGDCRQRRYLRHISEQPCWVHLEFSLHQFPMLLAKLVFRCCNQNECSHHFLQK